MWTGRMLAGGALVAAVLAGAAGQAMGASDPGWFDGKSAEERQAIVNYVYERTGHAPPYSGAPAAVSAELAQSMVDAGEDDAPLAPDGGALELIAATRVGLMTRLATMVPTLSAVGGTFVAGYAIGTGARKLFAQLTAPDGAGSGGSPGWSWGSISWRPAGYDILYGARVQQSPGAYLYDDGGGVIRWFEPPCGFSGFTPAAGARMQYAVPSAAECREYVRDVGLVDFPVFVDYPYLLESDIRPTAPLRPIDPADEIDRWEPYPPDPGARSPEADPQAPDWDYDVDEFTGVYNPLVRLTQTVKLRWGDAIDGWGYRHIMYWHGWDSAARLRTALALTDTTPAIDKDPRSFRYVVTLPTGPSGVTCQQRVIVSYPEDSKVPVGRHIITSFVDGVG